MDPFPDDWVTAAVLVAHPDDPEWGCAAAVAKWTATGKVVRYFIASRGEAGIPSLSPVETARIRDSEQRRAAAIVGVDEVHFGDHPDGRIRATEGLRRDIGDWLDAMRPDVAVTEFGGAQWAPGQPNHRDHIEFFDAVRDAYDRMTHPPRWLFAVGPDGTHAEVVDGFLDVAAQAIGAHARYLRELEPDLPVADHARRVVDATIGHDDAGARIVTFRQHRPAQS